MAFSKIKALFQRPPDGLTKLGKTDDPRSADAMILEQLVSRGADLSQPRHARFYLYFPDELHAKAAGGPILDVEGFEVKTGPSGKEWLLLAEITGVISEETIALYRRLFEEVATKYGGQYDGWEAALT